MRLEIIEYTVKTTRCMRRTGCTMINHTTHFFTPSSFFASPFLVSGG